MVVPDWCRNDVTDVFGMGLWFAELPEVAGTGENVVPIPVPTPIKTSIPVPEVPVLMYWNYRSVRCRYWCRNEITELSDTCNNGSIYRRYASVGTVPNTPSKYITICDVQTAYHTTPVSVWKKEKNAFGTKVWNGSSKDPLLALPIQPFSSHEICR